MILDFLGWLVPYVVGGIIAGIIMFIMGIRL